MKETNLWFGVVETIQTISKELFKSLCSLKLAILVIAALALELAAGTMIESKWDFATARYWIYDSDVFQAVLALLGLNILCVALSRFPWKKKHTAFLIAHAGILILLAGSWVSKREGIDGTFRLTQGQSSSRVELDQLEIWMIQENYAARQIIPWIPPNVKFQPIEYEFTLDSSMGRSILREQKGPSLWNFLFRSNAFASFRKIQFKIDQFLTHADSDLFFRRASSKSQESQNSKNQPAMKLLLEGGFMNLHENLWLWTGALETQKKQIGPASFEFKILASKKPICEKSQGPHICLFWDPKRPSELMTQAFGSSDSAPLLGKISLSQGFPQELAVPWKGGLKLSLQEWISQAEPQRTYCRAQIQYGKAAPPPALHLSVENLGDVWLGLGEQAFLKAKEGEFEWRFDTRSLLLPFSVELQKFEIDYQPGSSQAAAYRSWVNVFGKETLENQLIQMNEPLKVQGFTLYQSSFDEEDPNISVLTLNRDPGRPLKYWGSLLIVLGSILLFVQKKLGARKMKLATATLCLLLWALPSQAEEISGMHPSHLVDDGIASIPIQHGGRIKPWMTFARESVLLITGKQTFKGWNSLELILSWTVHPENWQDVPFILLSREDVRRQLNLDQEKTYFSPNELFHNLPLAQYAQELESTKNSQNPQNADDPRKKELTSLLERLVLYQQIYSGQAFTLVPQVPPAPWLDVVQAPQENPITQHFAKFMQAFHLGLSEETHVLADFLKREILAQEQPFESHSIAQPRLTFSNWDQAMESLPKIPMLFFSAIDQSFQKLRSVSLLMSAEVWYLKLRPFFGAWVFYGSGLLMGLLLPFVQGLFSKILYFTHWSAVFLGIFFHVMGMALRCFITGRPPVTNMYESMIWVSLGTFFFGWILYRLQRKKIAMMAALAMASLVLIAADLSPSVLDPSINPLVPVLRSNYWLTVHVLTITLSYAAFALVFILANISLFQLTQKKRSETTKDELAILIYRSMQFGVVLLTAGTILGGIWADYSWGRFWGWDPKEVWALITLLCYLMILHGRYTKWVGPFAFAMSSAVSFLAVVMAWYGVNFVLGSGLHSYGFSKGGLGFVTSFIVIEMGYLGFILFQRLPKHPRTLSEPS